MASTAALSRPGRRLFLLGNDSAHLRGVDRIAGDRNVAPRAPSARETSTANTIERRDMPDMHPLWVIP